MSTKIKEIRAREVLDSRGYPTVEVDMVLSSGIRTRAAVPSGGVNPTYGAVELRDGDPHRYFGQGVLNAVANINEILSKALIGIDAEDQTKIDQLLIGLDLTGNKSGLGANSILCISIACARAVAIAKGVPLYQHITRSDNATLLPVPMINIFDGGSHAQNNLDFQEFMIVPAGASNFREALRMGAEVFYQVKQVILDQGYSAGVGDEGGFAPDLQNMEAAMTLLLTAIEKTGYIAGEDIYFALDVAADNLYQDGFYTIKNENMIRVSADEVISFYENLVNRYPIISIEDGLAPDDWASWVKLNERLGNRIQIVGDKLFSGVSRRLADGIEWKVANAILVKPNQVGTLTEILSLIEQARQGSLTQILSCRSGETCDPFLASLAVACNTGLIKPGSVCRSERLSKYNELLRIEQELGQQARWIGINAFTRGA